MCDEIGQYSQRPFQREAFYQNLYESLGLIKSANRLGIFMLLYIIMRNGILKQSIVFKLNSVTRKFQALYRRIYTNTNGMDIISVLRLRVLNIYFHSTDVGRKKINQYYSYVIASIIKSRNSVVM